MQHKQKQIPQALIDAYTNTRYIVHASIGDITIHICKKHPQIDNLIKNNNTWAYITACNPGSVVLSKEENERRQSDLKKTILDAGLSFLDGEGIGEDPNWEPEASLFIPGIEKAHAKEIGAKYGQNAIVFGKTDEEAQLVVC